jgi:predicted ribosomally synthesized peptide with nif11-like leader
VQPIVDYFHAVVNAIAHNNVKPPRLTKQRFVAETAAAMAVMGWLLLRIRLGFQNHAPQQRAFGLAFHQQAADMLGGNLLGRAGGKQVLGERGGYGPGCVRFCQGVLQSAVVAIKLEVPKSLLGEMSKEQLVAFLEAVKANAGLQEQLRRQARRVLIGNRKSRDADAVFAIAKAAGFVITADDLDGLYAEWNFFERTESGEVGTEIKWGGRDGDFQERCHSLAAFQAAWIDGSA